MRRRTATAASAAALVAAAALAGNASAQDTGQAPVTTDATATTPVPGVGGPASTTPQPATTTTDPAAPATNDLGTLDVQVTTPPPAAKDTQSAAQKRREGAAKFLAQGRRAQALQAKQQQKDAAAAPFANLPSPLNAPPVTGVPDVLIDSFRVPPFLLPIYQAAGVEYGIRWEVLAAINEIETDYGRNLSVSTAGALGWMQFMPGTWATYGVDANNDGRKDPYNPVDAIFAAARYLKAAGGDTNLQGAIFSYNHAQWYVDSVMQRAASLAALPSDLIGALTGLTMGRFPVTGATSYENAYDASASTSAVKAGGNASVAIAPTAGRHSIDVYAKPGAAAVAVQDGSVVAVGASRRLGRFVQLRDVYGNTYTYGHLQSVSALHVVPRSDAKAASAAVRTPRQDPKPTAPATAGARGAAGAASASRRTARRGAASHTVRPKVLKERLFADPARVNAYHAGGRRQLVAAAKTAPVTPQSVQTSDLGRYLAPPYALRRSQVALLPLKKGSRVIAGSILGRVGSASLQWDTATAASVAAARHLHLARAPHLRFEIRPAGAGAPRVDPTPILDGWHLLASTDVYGSQNPLLAGTAAAGDGATIGQILLMSKETLERRVLADPAVSIYACGRQDIQAGAIDRRVLATLEFLAASGYKPTVSALKCGHSLYTTSGNISEHSTGDAVDISSINGTPIEGHQGPGSITDIVVRKLLTLQGTMKPHQIITLMQYPGTDNTLALPDHYDHIHVGFHPMFGDNVKLGTQLATILKPGQWNRLIGRIGAIQNPTVPVKPSRYALKVKVSLPKH